jgi:cytidylate kinase
LGYNKYTNIAITGLTACGKTFQARKVAEMFEFKYICASELMLESLGKTDTQLLNVKKRVWINREVCNEINTIRRSSNMDYKLDFGLLKIAKEESGRVFDCRTLPHLYKGKNLLKIYLNPSLADRANISYNSRSDKEYSLEEIKKHIDQKDKEDVALFTKLYGINITDTSVHDCVLDNGKLKPEETTSILFDFISRRISSNNAYLPGKITAVGIHFA